MTGSELVKLIKDYSREEDKRIYVRPIDGSIQYICELSIHGEYLEIGTDMDADNVVERRP